MTADAHVEAMTGEILGFAQFFVHPVFDTTPFAVARRRRWIDADGRPTQDGVALVRALQDQSGTRTIFLFVG